jgi:anaerobic selenocysteine-containing dehydrogenase
MRAEEVDVAAVDDGFFSALCMAKGIDPSRAMPEHEGRGPLRVLDLQIRSGPFGDRYGERPDGLKLASFLERPHGIDCGPLVPRLPDILATPSRRIELAPEHITADVPRLVARLDREEPGLVLISRRHLRSNNSWMHNLPKLVAGRARCTLLIHPDDAEAAGLRDGALARVTSAQATIEVPAEVSDEMMRGVVSLPHGWGHDKDGTRLAVARRHAGVNNNLLAPPDFFDPISNNAAVNGIPVEVAPGGPA